MEVEEMAKLQVGVTEDKAELLMQEAVNQTSDVVVDEDDNEDDWVKFDLRNPDALNMYVSRLERDDAPIPPVGNGEKACYYLGRLIYVHVYTQDDDDDDDEIKIDLRQWSKTPPQEGDKEGSSYEVIATSQGLVLSWDEWQKMLYYRKKVARNVRDIMADRRIEEKYEFGKNKFISVSWHYWYVVLRAWFQIEKDGRCHCLPGKKGIALKFPEYERLMLLEEDMLRLSDQHQDRQQHEQSAAISYQG
jgi:hypothetical protein